MAQLAIAAVGALALGPVGLGLTTAGTGFMLGSLAYSLMAPGQKSYGPRLNDLKVTGTEYGAAIPWVAGSPRVAGQIIWASERRETATEEEQGKGGGPTYTSYTYDLDLLILVSENEISGIARIWSNGELIYGDGVAQSGAWVDMRVYTGAVDQLPDPTYEAAVGLGNAPAYRGMGVVMIQGLQLGNGGSIPNLTFEVAKTMAQSDEDDYQDKGPNSFQITCDYQNNPGTIGFQGTVESPAKFGRSGHIIGNVTTPKQGLQIVGGANVLTIGQRNFTFRAWLYSPHDSYESSRGVIFANGSHDGYSYGLYISMSETGRLFIGVREFLISAFSEPEIYRLNEWFYLVIQRVGTSLKGYINGVQVLSVELPGGFFMTNDDPWEVGGSMAAHTNFNGYYDDVEFAWAVRSTVPPTAQLRADEHTAFYIPFNGIHGGLADTEDLRGVVDQVMRRCGYPPGDWDSLGLDDIEQPVRALALGSVSNSRSVLEALQQAFMFECSAAEQIGFRPRAIEPVVTIGFVDLGMSSGSGGEDEPFALTLGNDLELPAQLALSYPNMAGDYQAATEFSDRLLSGQQSTEAIQTALGLLPAEAKAVVDGLLMDRVASLATATLKLPLKYARLEPGDVINAVNSDGRTYRLRVQSKTDAMPIIELQCVLDDVGAIESAAVTDTGYVSTDTVIQPAGTIFEALDIPILRDADDAPGFYLAVAPRRAQASDRWLGAVAAQSWDGVNYAQLLTTTAQSVMGTATTALASWQGGVVFDERSTVTVQVSGELASSTREAMLLDESINALLLGSEILRFRSAALLSPGSYLLSGLLRGQRGTEWAMGWHAAGERCILLGNGLRRVASQANEIGLPRQIKAVTLGAFLSSGVAKDFTDAGVALKPFSPANPRALRDGGAIVVSWQRRTRLSYLYAGSSPVVPLGEALEAYRVRVLLGGVVLRTATVNAALFRYTEAMQVQDGLTSSSVPEFEICQLSAIAGAGYPAFIGIEALDAHDDFDAAQLSSCMHDGEQFIAVRWDDGLRVYVSADGAVFQHVGTHDSDRLGIYEEGVTKGDAGYAYFPKYYAYTGSGAGWYSALTPELAKTFPPATGAEAPIGDARPLCMAWDEIGHRYVRVLEDKTFATSADGLTWDTPAPMLLPEVPGGWAWYIKMSMRLFKSGGYWYALHSAFGQQYDAGSLMLMRSTDLIVWQACPGTAAHMPPPGVSSWRVWSVFAVAAKDGVFVITAAGARQGSAGELLDTQQLVLRSTDGFNFEIVYEQPYINTSGQSDFGEIKPVGEGGFVASGRGGVLVSTDAGLTWTRRAMDPPPKQMRSNGSVVVASRTTGSSGANECWYTTNGAMWRRSSAQEGNVL